MLWIVPVSGQFVVEGQTADAARAVLTRFLANEGLANIRVQAYGTELAYEIYDDNTGVGILRMEAP